MSDVTAAPPAPSLAPLRPTTGPDGTIGLTRADALRVALALNHLAALTVRRGP